MRSMLLARLSRRVHFGNDKAVMHVLHEILDLEAAIEDVPHTRPVPVCGRSERSVGFLIYEEWMERTWMESYTLTCWAT